ncbi:hypothetical protein PCASD_11478 [Puccinia coronata f. sp. avenae]|uniref:DUF726-domain-containing protein n=1 Tax=Puccinia coronata f. sp. avenae TaxID=200324 RepID=A0A2N5V3J4_9BASI|nr:hypothetical protein PCASD_11478 [Puccinia coronata f. sp. avenae]
MDNATKIDMFYERWEPFHLQIVSIALKYAYAEVEATRLDDSFQPLCEPALPPLSAPTTPTLLPVINDAFAASAPSTPDGCTHSEKSSSSIAHPPADGSTEEKADPAAPTAANYARVRPSSEKDKEREEELEAERREEDDDMTHQEWLDARQRASEAWLKFLLESLKVDPASVPSKPLHSDLAEISKEIPAAMHVEIIHDLVILSLSASHSQSQPTQAPMTASKSAGENLNYSALDRQLIFQVAHGLGIEPMTVYAAEKLVSQELFFIMQQAEQASENAGADQREEASSTVAERKLTSTSRMAIQAAAEKKKWLRYIGAGAGVIVGGVAIGLTGGLAAPVLAPFLVGLTGGALGFLATSGGAILIGTLFGLAGGGLVGYRAQRRLKGIDEFAFERLPDQDGEVDVDIPRIPSLHATIVSTGFLLTPTEYKDPWVSTFGKTVDRRDVYALKVETGAMLSAGKDLESYFRDALLQHGATEIMRHTVLASVCAALLLPASIYKAAAMALDNQYQRTRDICEKAGILLADMIEQRAHGARPLTLIGSGMGSITVFRAILELSKRGHGAGDFLIEQVILICSPLAPGAGEWKTVRRMAARRVVNVYSRNDWVLAVLARLDSLLSARNAAHVAGLSHLNLPHIHDIDVSDILHGHLELNSKLPLILDRINVNL